MKNRHSSLQKDERVADYISRNCKYYFLPLFKEVFSPPQLSEILGLSNFKDRSIEEIRSSILKAKKACCSHVKITLDREQNSIHEKVYQYAKGQKLGLVYQIFASSLLDEKLFANFQTLPQDCQVEWVLDEVNSEIVSRMSTINVKQCTFCLSVVVTKETDWSQLLTSEILQMKDSIHLCFGYHKKAHDHLLNCLEVERLLKKLQKKFPKIHFAPPKGVDIWDDRVLASFDMEPYRLPCFESRSANPRPRFSVIIPTYNNQNHVRVVLRHLYRQNIGLDQFELFQT